MTAYGEQNAMWRGGRIVASNGYVLIRVGTAHPMADIRGYAYEHRLVASEALGRALANDEQVHHRNGDKTDNRPENLVVVPDIAHHRVHHRLTGKDRKLPGEDNPLVYCACGCGESLRKYDSDGRPRQYISGHNPPQAPRQDALLQILASGSAYYKDMAKDCGTTARAVSCALSRLKHKGLVHNIGTGRWTRT